SDRTGQDQARQRGTALRLWRRIYLGIHGCALLSSMSRGMTFVLLFPGQGSQKPGMAQDLSESYPAAREVLMRGDESLGVSMSSLLFNGPESDLTLTQNAQPALFLHGAALFAVLRDRLAK